MAAIRSGALSAINLTVAVTNHTEDLNATQRLLDTIRAWAAACASTVAVSEVTNPADEFGSYCVMNLTPSRISSCELEILFIPGNPPQVGVLLDSWGRLVEGHHLLVEPPSGKERQFKTLFLEPRALSADTLGAICRAVSEGRIDVRAGIIGRRLVATEGSVRLSTRSLQMQGVTLVPLMIPKMLRRFGLGKVLSIQYEPWL